ncbi:MAG: AAA family ATPase [Euryarchaeota archaeon]|nr:AAA family ATPase [Euryarchaeota archaeon]MBV1729842.1 AAA family ATPase [Methanobacterium sp.]MBU4547702.1 AAA family ATPase [Euryarchaeota archaeon]MBU4607344.1 AAA family ATPase [Euryarchaeota archaeon]MBV1754026.1 AAA family ATPase [Methanobacterium sp.]
MKLLELEIQNFRGIKELKIYPQGKNFLVWGPNGSGKSAIVDALDFLLTGNISRMRGKGTKGITPKEHAPHVDSTVDEVEVKALIKLQNLKKPVEIKRSLKNAAKGVYDPSLAEYMEPVLELATRGQHVLTRREILNYITADSSTRARQIEKLLKLEEVENTRKTLNKTRNQLKNEYETAKDNLNTSQESVKNIIRMDNFTEDDILDFINENRKLLKGDKLEFLRSTGIKEGLETPGTITDNFINFDRVEKNILNLQDKLSTKQRDHFYDLIKKLEELNEKIASNSKLNNTIDCLRLTKLGLNLLDESGDCPLCSTTWTRDELEEKLNNRIKRLHYAKEDLEKQDELKEEILKIRDNILISLEEVKSAADTLELKNLSPKLNSLQLDLKRVSTGDADFNPDELKKIFKSQDIFNLLGDLLKIVRANAPDVTLEQLAWDNLTRLEEILNNYYKFKTICDSSFKSYNKAQILLDTFLKSRDSIIGDLFSQIEERFMELYRELHGSDESAFKAQLKPQGGGVEFYVDFHGRGIHPPHALHSEGHQDSMGICLYLALAERLTEGYIDLIILDDVMMSVDAPHRREICRLLASFFKGRQFFITTHDQTWARQLKQEGVVSSSGMMELYNWSIENGPYINTTQDMWEKIEEDLSKNDVNSAAFKLRRGSEEFFRTTCNLLESKVTFKEDQRWGLGDFLPATLSSYNELLKKAKIAADSWKNQDELMRLKGIEDNAKDVFRRSQAENWAVNINVHYNKWADFSVEDFRPVVKAFYDLFCVFKCDNCGGILHLSKNKMNLEAVRCNCGAVNWNLVKK